MGNRETETPISKLRNLLTPFFNLAYMVKDRSHQGSQLYRQASVCDSIRVKEALQEAEVLLPKEFQGQEINQCDGCQAGLPLVDGIHKDHQLMGIACTKHLYVKQGKPEGKTVWFLEMVDLLDTFEDEEEALKAKRDLDDANQNDCVYQVSKGVMVE